ncbi:cytochrome P450 71A9-like [Typha angustifolia]|uniref:cytochrome P450 71A9-like n=1 Tax=Typha angustifolia TaxID=59011 RepID=UPI003C2AB26D
MHIRLGHIPTLVISSPAGAHEILKTHDLKFCTRPQLTTWQCLSYGGLDLCFAPYSDYWIQMRKMSSVELFNAKRVQLHQPIREQEVHNLVQSIAKASALGEAVNLDEMILSLLSNVACRITFGKRSARDGECGRSKFHDMIKETIRLMGGFVAGDFFPSMHRILNVVTGVQRRLDRNSGEMDRFLEEIITERERCGYGDDFASVLLRVQKDPNFPVALTRDHIKAMLMITFIAGSDTAAVNIVWAMTELMRNPIALKTAQEEVRRVGQGKEKVEESDLPLLHYNKMVVKESLRLHPPGPLILPRECREDCRIDGYDIPAKTRVYINAFAIGRDPKTWEEPEEFRPERFEHSPIEFKGKNFELVPFGGGRRICPGMAMGAAIVELALANLLFKFDWALPNGMSSNEIDMGESFGIVVGRKVPLLLTATLPN